MNIKDLTATFMGDSVTSGVLSDNHLNTNFLGYRQLLSEQLKKTYNFSIAGFHTHHLLDQLNQDVTLKSCNEITHTKQTKEIDGITREMVFPTIEVEDITISSALSKSDLLIVSIGGNNIGRNMRLDAEGNLILNICQALLSLEKAIIQKNEIFAMVHKINPEIVILDMGMYFPFGHLNGLELQYTEQLFEYLEQKTATDNEALNLYKVELVSKIEDNKLFCDNRCDIHPSRLGHEIIAAAFAQKIKELN